MVLLDLYRFLYLLLELFLQVLLDHVGSQHCRLVVRHLLHLRLVFYLEFRQLTLQHFNLLVFVVKLALKFHELLSRLLQLLLEDR